MGVALAVLAGATPVRSAPPDIAHARFAAQEGGTAIVAAGAITTADAIAFTPGVAMPAGASVVRWRAGVDVPVVRAAAPVAGAVVFPAKSVGPLLDTNALRGRVSAVPIEGIALRGRASEVPDARAAFRGIAFALPVAGIALRGGAAAASVEDVAFRVKAVAAPVEEVALPAEAVASPAVSPMEAARVIAVYPHDSRAFTQGLFFHDGRLFESTGQHGESAVREVDLATGKVKREVKLPPEYFGEGSTAWGDTIVSLTWQHGKAFRWDRETFRKTGTFRYPGEGWGLTQDGESLILSDGTPVLRFLDPATFAERRRITVTWRERPVGQLNELEFVRGEVLANIWHTDLIARIDPASGAIKGFIDLSAVTASLDLPDSEAVLNGIAYDAKADKLYITGKDWPKLFEIALPSR